jgi:hypothetical protein
MRVDSVLFQIRSPNFMQAEENLVSRVLEEMKALPSRVAKQLMNSEVPLRGRRRRLLHPS